MVSSASLSPRHSLLTHSSPRSSFRTLSSFFTYCFAVAQFVNSHIFQTGSCCFWVSIFAFARHVGGVSSILLFSTASARLLLVFPSSLSHSFFPFILSPCVCLFIPSLISTTLLPVFFFSFLGCKLWLWLCPRKCANDSLQFKTQAPFTNYQVASETFTQ